MSLPSEDSPPLARWMSLSDLFYVYRARMRVRQTVIQELLVVLGIAVGVALLFASQVATASLKGSVQQISGQLIGSSQYQLDARGPGGFSAGLVERVEGVRGVTEVLPVLEQPATLTGAHGRQAVDLLGVSPRWMRSGGTLLRHFSAQQLEHQQALALPEPFAQTLGVGPLQTVGIQIGAKHERALVGATVGEADLGELTHIAVAMAPIRYAQQLTGMHGRLSRIFVHVQPQQMRQAHTALARLAADYEANLEPAGSEATQFQLAAAPQGQSEQLFAAISAMVGFLFAFNAMLLTINSRRHLIEALRLRGSTRGMIWQLLACEALMLGVLACGLGIGVGEALSLLFFHASPGYLAFAFPVGSPRIVSWQAIVMSVAAGMLAVLVGVLAPLRDIFKPTLSHRRPVRRLPAIRIATGLAALAVTTAIVIERPQSAVLAMFTLLIALGCLLPLLFDLALRGFATLQTLVPFGAASPRLAVVELRDPATRVRSLAVAATAAVAVFGAVSIQGSKQNLQAGLGRTASEVNHSTGVWVSTAGQANALGTTWFHANTLAKRLEGLPGVRAVGIYRGGFLTIGARRVWVIAPPNGALPAGQVIAGNPVLARKRLRAGGWAVISEALANERHLHIGDSFVLPSPRAERLRVAALSSNMGWPPGALVLSADQYARDWGTSQAAALNLSLASGASAARVRRETIGALGPHSGMSVQTATERAAGWMTITAQGLGRLTQIATLALVAAVLAIAGVMGSMIWQRRPHIAYIKRQGYTRAILWRTLLWECALLVLTGSVTGAAFGLYGQLVLSHALAVVTGFPVLVGVGVAVPVICGAAVCAAALAILAVPGYLAVRVRPTVTSPA